MNITVDDLSPFINYQPPSAWSQHNSNNDLTAANYFQSTFSRTRRIGANATISFNGPSISILGAQNGNSGTHTVILDGAQVASGPTLGDTIFEAFGLSDGSHTLTVTNGEDVTGLTIDQVIWSSSAMESVSIDDSDPAFQYSPPNKWTNSSAEFQVFKNGTGHRTTTQGAQTQYTFEADCDQGDGISIYGSVGSNYGAYGVAVDQQAAQTYNAQKQVSGAAMLFYVDGLGNGSHTVTLINQGPRILDIDYAVISRTSPLTSGTPTPPTAATHSHGLPTGALVGIILGAIIVLALAILAVTYRFINSKLMKKMEDDYMTPNHFDTLGSTGSAEEGQLVALTAKEKALLGTSPVEQTHEHARRSPRRRSTDSSASDADTLVAADLLRTGARLQPRELPTLPLSNTQQPPLSPEQPPPSTFTPASHITFLPRYSQMTDQQRTPATSRPEIAVVSPTVTPNTAFTRAGAPWYPTVTGVSEEASSYLASTYQTTDDESVLRSSTGHEHDRMPPV